MPTRLMPIPFALGQDESIASRVLPAGPLREATNVRQRSSGALGVRADYASTSMAEYGGTLVPYDLYNLNGKLVALGDRQSRGRPTDLFTLVGQTAGNWQGTLSPTATGARVPSVVGIRDVGSIQETPSSVGFARVAAVNGIVCLVYGTPSTSGAAAGLFRIFRADTGATLSTGTLNLGNPRVVAVGNSLWIIGVDAGNDLAGLRFDTTTASAPAAAVVLYTGTVTNNIFDAVSVKAASVTQFAFIVRDGATTVIRRFNEAGTQQTTFAGPAVAPDVITLEADSIANRIVVAYRVGAADAFVQTYNLTTNASIAGPTAMFAEAVTGELYIQRLSQGARGVILVTEDAGTVVRRARFDEDSLGAPTRKRLVNYVMLGRGISATGQIIQAFLGGGANQLCALIDDALTQADTATMLSASTDIGIASSGPPGGTAGIKGGECALDVSSGRAYWSRLVTGTDGQAIPVVSEFRPSSTGRRQSCQLANALFIAGGVPLHFDGIQVAENGFPERPAFNAALVGTVGGALLPGGVYDYVMIWKYQDGLNDVTLSAISAIQTITLTAGQNAVQADLLTPHTLRRDLSTGSCVTLELYRTRATIATTTATLVSTRNFETNPASAGDFTSATGLQWSINGGATLTTAFAAGDNTLSEIITAINATPGFAAVAVCTQTGNTFQVQSLTAGSGGSVAVLGGNSTNPGLAYLGLFVAQNATGTTTPVKGTVFQRVATTVGLSIDDFGQSVPLFDVMSDTTILTQVPLYTNAERGALSGILEHEAPPPCEFCVTVGRRVFIGGLPDRSEVRISKDLFTRESIAFTADASFRARVEGNVTGVAQLGGFPVAFTADRVFVFPDQFADDTGNNGSLGPRRQLDTEEGCTNENSIISTPVGVFYQSRTGKLMRLQPGASGADWIGRRMQATLALFPTITAAAYVETDNCVVFTAQNLAGNASVILVFDLLIGQWYLDTFSVAQVQRAAVDYLGRLAYIDSSTIRLQSASLTPSAFIPMTVKTGSINPFDGRNNGWGKMPSIAAACEFRGNCRLRLRISYDDGVTFTNLKTHDLLTSGGPKNYAVGGSVNKQWWPGIVKGRAYVLEFNVLPDGSNTPSEGLILNAYTLELEGAKPGRARLPAADKG